MLDGLEAPMQQSARASLLLLTAAVLTASCSDTDARLSPTEPTGIGTSAVKVAATTATASAQPVNDPVCPAVEPFKVAVGVVVSASGSSTIVITGIRTQFTDTTGRQAPTVTVPMPPVTLPAPGPTPVFGSAAAVSERTFPIVFGIGCGTGTTGTVIVVVEGSDVRGRRFSEQATVAVQ
jgi:hypothetical protein